MLVAGVYLGSYSGLFDSEGWGFQLTSRAGGVLKA